MPSFTARQLRFLDKYAAEHNLTTQEDLDNAFNESVIKESENIKSSEAEKTRSDLKRLKELFEIFVDMFRGKKEPTPSHEIWTPQIVSTHMFGFFATMVRLLSNICYAAHALLGQSNHATKGTVADHGFDSLEVVLHVHSARYRKRDGQRQTNWRIVSQGRRPPYQTQRQGSRT